MNGVTLVLTTPHRAVHPIVVSFACILLSSCASAGQPGRGGSPDGRVSDETFERRDAALRAEFESARQRCDARWADDDECRALLGGLRDEELQLFADVRAHQFRDITRSNYWHRGRLKFPSEIELLLQQVTTRPSDGPPGRQGDELSIECPDPVTVDQTLVGTVDGWRGFGWVVDGIREIAAGGAARSSNHHPSAIDLFDGPPTDLRAIGAENPGSNAALLRWNLPRDPGGGVWMVCRYSGTYLTLGREMPPGISTCEARFDEGRVKAFTCR